jgi:hypothetical protein
MINHAHTKIYARLVICINFAHFANMLCKHGTGGRHLKNQAFTGNLEITFLLRHILSGIPRGSIFNARVIRLKKSGCTFAIVFSSLLGTLNARYR